MRPSVHIVNFLICCGIKATKTPTTVIYKLIQVGLVPHSKMALLFFRVHPQSFMCYSCDCLQYNAAVQIMCTKNIPTTKLYSNICIKQYHVHVSFGTGLLAQKGRRNETLVVYVT
jgi:hypothetical protein